MNYKKILNDSDYKKLSVLKFCDTTSYGLVFTKVKLSDNLYSHVNMQLCMKSVNNDTLVMLITSIFSNKVHIQDFKSKFKNFGNGKQILIYFNKIIKELDYQISYIEGQLSPIDYEYWDKSIYMYSHYIQNNYMLIDNQLSPSEFLSVMKKYRYCMVNFKLFL